MSEQTLELTSNPKPETSSESTTQSKPKKSGSFLSASISIVAIMASLLFLANLTFGLIEIPDNLPIIGNIDEVLATTILVTALSRFGIHLAPNLDPKRRGK